MARFRSRRVMLPIAAGLVLIVVGSAVVVALTRGGGSDGFGPAPGVALLEDGRPVKVVRTPTSYRVVYRFEERLGEIRVSTEERWVHRPFDSRSETRSGEPPGHRRDSVGISAFARTGLGHAGDERSVAFASPPTAATYDLRIDPVLGDALDRGLLTRRGQRRVLGRRCQVYRSGEPLGSLLAKPPTDTDYTDTCVDEAGLTLVEVIVAEGETRSRRVAVEVREEPQLDRELFRTADTDLPVDQGGGSVRELVPGSKPPGDFWQLDRVPAGFRPFGRFTVIPPQPENFNDPTRTGQRIASVADIWVRGPDLLIVDQGGTLHGSAPFEANPKNPSVEVGELGEAEIRLGARGIELRTLMKGGRYLTVGGTRPVDELIAVARALRQVEGGELRFKDE